MKRVNRMKSRRRGRRRWNIPVLCISCALALNIIGISYAAWSDGVTSETKISLGELDVMFDHYDESDEGLNVLAYGDTVTITGTIPHDYNNTFIIGVSKSGTVPYRLNNEFDGNDIVKIKYNDDHSQLLVHVHASCNGACDQKVVRNYNEEVTEYAMYIATLQHEASKQVDSVEEISNENASNRDEVAFRCNPPTPPTTTHNIDVEIPVVQSNLWQGGS